MARLVVALVLALCSTTVAVAGDVTPRGVIDLNEPGTLEALQRANPPHYQKVTKILEEILRRPASDVPRWIQTSFAARDVRYRPVVLTSHPPKRRLSFALDATRYEIVITLTNVRGDVVPAK